MSSPIPFVKMAGAGNDFILVDGRRGQTLDRAPSALAREWCDRKRSIGADGLLLVQGSRRGNARMRIFNPDGSEPTMCGNGLRCVAWYLHSTNGGRRSWTVETGAGVMQAQITGKEQVRIFFIPPKSLHLGRGVIWRGKRLSVHSVNTGVPHAVLLVSRLDALDLDALGPFVRRHRLFKPQGTNVNLLRIRSPHRASIRTYERGVEEETQACGTGTVASVVIGAALGKLKPPVQMTTAGGEKLTVGYFLRDTVPDTGRGGRYSSQGKHPLLQSRRFDGLYLEGPARILFQGGIAR
ncbi:MAG: diaminopimelate epimerase [Candidatus Omnitrophica bacterium]|nr:diaminopimelate epimerase [Candidatus Omnitrophota bacterium]